MQDQFVKFEVDVEISRGYMVGVVVEDVNIFLVDIGVGDYGEIYEYVCVSRRKVILGFEGGRQDNSKVIRVIVFKSLEEVFVFNSIGSFEFIISGDDVK